MHAASPLYDTHTGTTFHTCCGKDICIGCIHALDERGGENMDLCPFCRTSCPTSNEEAVERTKKLMEKGNADAFHMLASCYADGTMGVSQDRAKALVNYI